MKVADCISTCLATLVCQPWYKLMIWWFERKFILRLLLVLTSNILINTTTCSIFVIWFGMSTLNGIHKSKTPLTLSNCMLAMQIFSLEQSPSSQVIFRGEFRSKWKGGKSNNIFITARNVVNAYVIPRQVFEIYGFNLDFSPSLPSLLIIFTNMTAKGKIKTANCKVTCPSLPSLMFDDDMWSSTSHTNQALPWLLSFINDIFSLIWCIGFIYP